MAVNLNNAGPACLQVLSTVELMEKKLLKCSPRVLIRLYKTNHRVRNIINSSLELRERLRNFGLQDGLGCTIRCPQHGFEITLNTALGRPAVRRGTLPPAVEPPAVDLCLGGATYRLTPASYHSRHAYFFVPWEVMTRPERTMRALSGLLGRMSFTKPRLSTTIIAMVKPTEDHDHSLHSMLRFESDSLRRATITSSNIHQLFDLAFMLRHIRHKSPENVELRTVESQPGRDSHYVPKGQWRPEQHQYLQMHPRYRVINEILSRAKVDF